MWEWLQGLTGGAPAFVGSVTGSGVGLIALVIGALFNAHLNRRRDDRLRSEEAKAVAAAIRAELDGIRSTLDFNAERLESDKLDPRDNSANVFFGPDIAHQVRILPHITPKLVLLDTKTIREVIDAYTVVEQHGQNCIVLGAKLSESVFPGRRIIVVHADQVKRVAKMGRHTANDIQRAIRQLDTYLG